MTLSIPSPLFAGCKSKLDWAREHAKTLRNEGTAWGAGEPYSIIKQNNADFTVYEFVVRMMKDPPLVRWSLILADCINNAERMGDEVESVIAELMQYL